ncbi:MAG: PQQ-binding-like beta-propeller repeat protein [Flavobacteriaceae bacterium]
MKVLIKLFNKQTKLFAFTLFILFGFTQSTLAIQDIGKPKVKWKFKTNGSVRSTAVIDGTTIFFGSSDGYIYALNKLNGALIWKYKTEGGIVSSPAIQDSSLYISSRDNTLYSLNRNNGTLNWKFEMKDPLPDDHGGWKYFMASPVVSGENVLIGSGDGNLYAINTTNGTLDWKFKTNGRIRATPLVHKDKIYQPSNDGYVYILSLEGKMDWKFETLGVSYNPEDYSFDRSSIIAQPQIVNNLLVIASRDGNTYAIDLNTQETKWKFTYGNTWAMSTTIEDNTVYVGWSTNDIFSALDLKTGEEKWQYKTGAHNFPKGLLADASVYITSSDGKLHRLTKSTGKKVWEYNIGEEIYASPIYDTASSIIFFGCDDGNLYAVDEGSEVHKVVYHPYDERRKLRNPKGSKEIAGYLEKHGFHHIKTEENLRNFIEDRIDDNAPSVLVFSHLVIPRNVLGTHPSKGLMRQYLNEGGKVLWLGDIPNFYERNSLGKPMLSRIVASALLDVEFKAAETGSHFSQTTQEGKNWGLPAWTKTRSTNINSKNVVPLAYNEFNEISFWVKKFHPRSGSGFVSGRTWGSNVSIKEKDLDLIYRLAIYGLE